MQSVSVDVLLTERLDHPECVIWDPRGLLYAGGEAGQVYSISLDGRVVTLAELEGRVLGLALDGDGGLYACDVGSHEVVRIDLEAGRTERFIAGVDSHRLMTPNYIAFDRDGNLFVTDSGRWGEDDGVILRVTPSGIGSSVWSTAASKFPNGCCLDSEGASLLVVESMSASILRLPIESDGTAGTPALVADLAGTVPDGIACAADGTVLVSCYRPDRIYEVVEGAPRVLADDPRGQVLAAPANVAFFGDGLETLAVANLGAHHITTIEYGKRGATIERPSLRSARGLSRTDLRENR